MTALRQRVSGPGRGVAVLVAGVDGGTEDPVGGARGVVEVEATPEVGVRGLYRPTLEPLGEQHAIAPGLIAGQSFEAILLAWEAARQANVALVETTDEDQWTRRMMHPELGEATFVALVLRWCRHDAEHLRQIEILARNSQERDL